MGCTLIYDLKLQFIIVNFFMYTGYEHLWVMNFVYNNVTLLVVLDNYYMKNYNGKYM